VKSARLFGSAVPSSSFRKQSSSSRTPRRHTSFPRSPVLFISGGYIYTPC
jgi:hypothetical protein